MLAAAPHHLTLDLHELLPHFRSIRVAASIPSGVVTFEVVSLLRFFAQRAGITSLWCRLVKSDAQNTNPFLQRKSLGSYPFSKHKTSVMCTIQQVRYLIT